MDALLGLLFLIALAALIIGLINPKLVIRWGNKFTRKRVAITYGTAAIAFVVIASIISPPADEVSNAPTETTVAKVAKKSTQTTKAPSTRTTKAPSTTTTTAKKKEALSDYANPEIKAVAKKAFANLDITEAFATQSEGFVSISYNATVWDENDSIFDVCRKSEKIMPAFFKIKGVNEVKVTLVNEFTDIYGKSEVMPAVSITIPKEEADKIVWDKVNSLNRAGLVALASDLYVHPVILTKINNEDIERSIAIQRLRK